MKYSPQIGDKIEVTQPHLKWDLCIYQVTKTSIEGDSRGQTELSTLETHEKGVQTNRYELSENTIVVDGQQLPLATPSAQQSGLKIQVNETLEPGILYEFMLDFDVDKSIVAQGNGGYSLKPVIRATTVAESGAISGTIVPPGIITMITADNGTTQVSTYANPLGVFLLSGVPDGTYTITVQADLSLGIPPVVIENVIVVQGEVTSIGEINL
jgi:hypothetical protein